MGDPGWRGLSRTCIGTPTLELEKFYNQGMKMWQESARILDRLQSIRDSGGDAAIAVLVRIEGSSYRRPGAKLLVGSDGSSHGSISGGCLEEDVRQIALDVMSDQTPRALRYKTGSDDETVWGLGLGCDGIVDLFVYPAATSANMEAVAAQRQLFQGNEAFAVAIILEASPQTAEIGRSLVIAAGQTIAGESGDPELDGKIRNLAASCESSAGASRDPAEGEGDNGGAAGTCGTGGTGGTGIYSLGAARVFLEVHQPPPNLLVFGAGDDAIPLVRLAADVGFRVSLIDHRAGYLTADRFPNAWRFVHARDSASTADLPIGERSFAVVKTHSLLRDGDWVRALVSIPLPYVGLLGPRDRRKEILADLSEEERRSVYGPVGLDLGAEGPEQVALSVVAELLAVVSGRTAGHLRDSAGSIHARRDDER
jgi:xanthine dehydrogenase accessory factor